VTDSTYEAEKYEAMARAFGTYDVVGFFSDVHPFESYIDKWEEEYAEKLCVRARERYPIGWKNTSPCMRRESANKTTLSCVYVIWPKIFLRSCMP